MIHSRHRLPPYDYQHRAYDFVKYHGAAYLMMDMGAGKTRTCIEVGKTLEIPMFVLTTRFAATNTWPDEFREWNPGEKFVVLHGPKKEERWKSSDKRTNIILNYDGLKWFRSVIDKRLRPLQKYFFVFDEASMLRSHKTVRWEILHDMMPMMSEYRVALDGTPMPNGLLNLWSQFFLLDKGKVLGTDYYRFKNKYFNDTGPVGKPPYKITVKPGADEQIYSKINPITMYLSEEEVKNRPDVVYNPIRLELPSCVQKQYQEMEDEFMLEFPDDVALARSSAVQGHKLRQILQGAVYTEQKSLKLIHSEKAQVAYQLHQANPDRPLLVAIHFKFELTILNSIFRKQLPSVTGGTGGPKVLDAWNRGELPVLVVHPKSVARGLNLQHGGSHLLMLALPWELDVYKQLIKRLARPGQKNTVTISLVSFKKTIDDKVAKALQRKDLNQQQLFNSITEGR